MTKLTKKEHIYLAHQLHILLKYNLTGSQHQKLIDMRWDKKFLELGGMLKELDRKDYEGIKKK